MSGEAASKARVKLLAVRRACLLLSALLVVLALAGRWAQVDRVPHAPPAEVHASAAAEAEPRQASTSAPSGSEPTPAPRLARAALTCTSPMEHTELWGDVVAPGTGPGAVVAPTAGECCEACARTRGCNAWVSCSDERACGRQCWLKWQLDPTKIVTHAASPGTPWTSGVHAKDFADSSNPYEPGEAEAITLKTAEGKLRIRLHPEWSLGSVVYARRVARHDLCTARCHFYRAEPNFLLQGALHAVIPANNDTTRRGLAVAMERGDVAWAGGFAGPDFFITHVRVGGFGASHTVWGSLDGAESLAVLDRLVALPASAGPHGGMRMLGKPVPFDAVIE
ncbi:hypothetical protein KFE25_005569 [Diacronema lutheri]|uniref:Apple domain-containing protein n=1 Tax=Diacronema lutheri TaxID=2081491 RepID=A0A8J6CAY5_DIALT|nr:hypothetical protein KFE25_005569 [Diacronema lutheri]